MKVKLIQMTQNPIDVMWTAARTCYSAESPIEIWEDLDLYYNVVDELSKMEDIELTTDKKEQTEKHWNLVKQVLSSGHDSIAQHIQFTFAIEGISRSCSHQLVRHRHAVFSQKSQRYVEIKESQEELDGLFNLNDYGPKNFETSKIGELFDKYFTENEFKNVNGYYHALDEYLYAIKNRERPEDARRFLPNATKTDVVMSMNLGELIHVSHLRLCSRSQLEIRQLFQAIKKEVEAQDERLASLLVPSCEVHGFCTEHQCCGRKPKLEEVLEGYEKYKGLEK